jgi:hypothetical protein
VLDALNSAGATAMQLAARNALSTAAEAAAALLLMLRAGADPCVRGVGRKGAMQNFAEKHAAFDRSGEAKGEAATMGVALSATAPATSAGLGPDRGPALPQPDAAQAEGLLARFLYSETFSDVSVVVAPDDELDIGAGARPTAGSGVGARIPAHRIVLAAQGRFFAAALEGGWAEGGGARELQLRCGSEALARRLLSFAYTGRLDLARGDARGALELLRLACRYDVPRLVAALQTFIITGACIAPGTAWAVHGAAEQLGEDASRVRAAAANYVLIHFADGPGTAAAAESDAEALEMLKQLLLGIAGPLAAVAEAAEAEANAEVAAADAAAAAAGAAAAVAAASSE